MKKLIKLTVTALMVIILMCHSVAPCFAAVNEKDAPVGSTVEYTISIADCVQKITGIHIEVYFDQTKLEIVEVNTDNLTGGTTVNDNQKNDGTIRVVNGMVNGEDGLECKEKTDLVKVTFKVIAEGDSQIKYYIPYLYDYDMINLYEYTLSQTISVDGTVVSENEPPVLADDSDLEKVDSFDKGDFMNYPEGTGSGVKETAAPTQVISPIDGDSADGNTADADGEQGNDYTVIIVVACAAVIVIAVVVLAVVKAKTNK